MKSIKVVAGLIWRNGRLLVCQRHRQAAFPLQWEFPGGKVEPHETEADALKRELQEELGIEVADAEKEHSYSHTYDNNYKVMLTFFDVRHYRKRVKNLVFEKIRWALPEELPHFNFLEGDLRLVRQIIREKRRNR